MQRMDAPIIVYDKGPAFERLCPKCARFLKFPKTFKWRQHFDDTIDYDKLECSRCGPVEPVMIGWDGDF